MPFDAAAANALLISSRHARLRFLRTELQVANTMLNLAGSSLDPETRRRREAAAEDACAEVARNLGSRARTAFLSRSERAELTAGLDALQRRQRARS